MISALIFIIQAFAHLFLLILLLRFWMPWFRADFRNPIAQGILRLTSPLVIPVRRVVPPIGRLDTATVIVAFAIQYLTIWIILALRSVAAGIGPIALTSIIDLGMLSLRLFIVAIIIRIVLAWIAPHTYNPATAIISTITEPLLRPFRRFVPPLGGIDISPIFALILFAAISIMLSELRPLPI
jgi:YggT family protein